MTNHENEKKEISDAEIFAVVRDIAKKKDPKDERLVCYAQPIFDTRAGAFRRAEILMRLNIDGTIIKPNRFISQADASGDIFALTFILLHKVCRWISIFSCLYSFDHLTVNFPPSAFCQKDVKNQIYNIIQQYHLSPSQICIELTEQSVIDEKQIQDMVKQVQTSGVQFYLDDFGSGYSSLARIAAYPFKVIKIDKSLLDAALVYDFIDELLGAVIHVFKKYGYEVLMEGVESKQGNACSINKGVDYIQGFLYARPVPLEELGNYFAGNK